MQSEFRLILASLDVQAARRYAARHEAHLPRLGSDFEVLALLHCARTATQTIVPRLRFYSHRWLLDHGLPSQLPDRLRPSAERMYPKIVRAVGVAVGSKHAEVKHAITGAMNGAINDCYANGDTDDLIVSTQMREARARERKALGLPPRPQLPPLWTPWSNPA
jgi:hypothetical protein